MRIFKFRFVALIALMLIVLTGCVGASKGFSDDFSDTSSGWVGGSYTEYAQGYVGGRYVFQIFVPDLLAWSTPGKNFSDVTVEAMVSTEGQSDNHYGLICRANDDEFYYFAVSTDGYYGIYRRDADGNLLPLTGDSMLRSTVIRGDGQQNRVTASCLESTLSLYVNGQKLAEVNDEALDKGDVGMAAGTLSSTGTNIWFDDLVVSIP